MGDWIQLLECLHFSFPTGDVGQQVQRNPPPIFGLSMTVEGSLLGLMIQMISLMLYAEASMVASATGTSSRGCEQPPVHLSRPRQASRLSEM